MSELAVTNLSTLGMYAQGAIVELPPFAENQPFVVRLKRPSMMGMIKSGHVPNELLKAATELFSGGTQKSQSAEDSIDQFQQMIDMLEIVCEESFVEPTYKEIKDAGLDLTDEQKMFVFSYAQNGVKALINFRQE